MKVDRGIRQVCAMDWRSLVCVFVIVTSSLHHVSSYTQSQQCSYDFATGSFKPALDVFVIDRSQSVSIREFKRAVEFLKQLIQKRFRLSTKYNRVAVLTFARDVTVDLDYVTSDVVAAECELFQLHGGWQNISYDCENAYMNPQSLYGALNQSQKIFAGAQSSSEVKRLWLMTDFHEFDDVILERFFTSVTWPGVQKYGVGLNVHARSGDVVPGRNQSEVDLIKQRFCVFTTGQASGCDCQYRRLHDTLSYSWEDLIDGLENLKTDLKNSELVDVSSNVVCAAFDDSCVHGCQCREFLTTPHSILCTADDKAMTSMFTAFLIVICIMSTLSACVLTAVLIHKCRHNQEPCSKTSLPVTNMSKATSTQDLSYEIEGYLAPSEWFQPTQRLLTVRRRNSDSSLLTDLKQYNNSLYQLPDISKKSPPRRKLYLPASQTLDTVTAKKMKGPATPHPYMEIIEPDDNTSKSATQQTLPFPCLEIVPNNKNYEPVTVRLKAPPSGHSYESFRFPSSVKAVMVENLYECESGYASKHSSTENLSQMATTSGAHVKRDKSSIKSVLHFGTKKFKNVRSKFEIET